MPARLVPLIAGSAPVVPLLRPVLLLGRHPECDVRIDLPAVSRRHCCLALADDRLLIRDLGSRHGVWVNGDRTEEARLRAGDEVAIGPLVFRFEDDAPAPSPRKAPSPAQNRPNKAPAAPPSIPNLPADPDGDLMPVTGLFPMV